MGLHPIRAFEHGVDYLVNYDPRRKNPAQIGPYTPSPLGKQQAARAKRAKADANRDKFHHERAEIIKAFNKQVKRGRK